MRAPRHGAVPRQALLGSAVAIAMGLVACDRTVPPHSPEYTVLPDSSQPLRPPGFDGSMSILASDPIILEEASSFVISVISTECAAQGNTITLTSPGDADAHDERLSADD